MTTVHSPLELTTTLAATTPYDHRALAHQLAAHQIATALVRKSVIDPVPIRVWWRVTDALRASLLHPPATAIDEVDGAIAALLAHIGRPAPAQQVTLPGQAEGAARALRVAQALVARLVFSPDPTSPTLLHVRLARLRRVLLSLPA